MRKKRIKRNKYSAKKNRSTGILPVLFIVALLSLFHQRLMEIYALKSMMAEENVDIDFDVPTDVELLDLATKAQEAMIEEFHSSKIALARFPLCKVQIG